MLKSVFHPIVTIAIVLMVALPTAGEMHRPRAGIGILVIRPYVPDRADELKALVLYNKPGVGRAAVVNAARLPSLAVATPASASEYVVAVTGKRGEWLRIVYDDAGRGGWLKAERYWSYFSWLDYLPGRIAYVLPDSGSDRILLRKDPADEAPVDVQCVAGEPLRILSVNDEWIRVAIKGGGTGWLRWRDHDGRLMVGVEGVQETR